MQVAIVTTVAYIIYFIAVVFMILAILLQEGKGGGLAGLGGARAEATFGASNPLRRFTVVMALVMFFIAVFLDFVAAQAGRQLAPAPESGTEGVAAPEEPGEAAETAEGEAAQPAAGEEAPPAADEPAAAPATAAPAAPEAGNPE